MTFPKTTFAAVMMSKWPHQVKVKRSFQHDDFPRLIRSSVIAAPVNPQKETRLWTISSSSSYQREADRVSEKLLFFVQSLRFVYTVSVTVFVSGIFDLYNVLSEQHHRVALNPFLNRTRNGDFAGTCKRAFEGNKKIAQLSVPGEHCSFFDKHVFVYHLPCLKKHVFADHLLCSWKPKLFMIRCGELVEWCPGKVDLTWVIMQQMISPFDHFVT